MSNSNSRIWPQSIASRRYGIRRPLVLGVLLAGCLALAGTRTVWAQAQSFDFDFSGSGYSANGVLGGTSLGDGYYLINSISGTLNGQSLSLLPTTTIYSQPSATLPFTVYTNGFWTYDDVLYTGAAYGSTNGAHATDGLLDYYGLGLSVPGDTSNVLGDLPGYPGSYIYQDSLQNSAFGSFTANAVAAPEIDPSSAFDALTLLAGALLVLRGRLKTSR